MYQARRVFPPLLAALGVQGLRCDSTAQPGLEGLKETVTSRVFPFARENNTNLYAVQCRCMMQLCILPQARAYAYGVYTDERLQQSALRLYNKATTPSGSPPLTSGGLVKLVLDECERESSGFVASGGCLQLVLVMHRDIDGEHMAHGFHNSIEKRLKRLRGERKLPQKGDTSTDEVLSLVAAIKKLPLKAGEEVVFTWKSSEGGLDVSVGGKSVVRLLNPLVIRALFEVYVGEGAVSSYGARSFADNVFARAQKGSGYSSADVSQEYARVGKLW